MIVYVETNFLLELAYLQEEHAQCETLLDLAAQGSLTLLAPAFCGIEARMSLAQRCRSRALFREGLAQYLRELGRSTHMRMSRRGGCHLRMRWCTRP